VANIEGWVLAGAPQSNDKSCLGSTSSDQISINEFSCHLSAIFSPAATAVMNFARSSNHPPWNAKFGDCLLLKPK
jgi:hypothetical protein